MMCDKNWYFEVKILKRDDSVCGSVHLKDGTCSCVAAIYFVSLKVALVLFSRHFYTVRVSLICNGFANGFLLLLFLPCRSPA